MNYVILSILIASALAASIHQLPTYRSSKLVRSSKFDNAKVVRQNNLAYIQLQQQRINLLNVPDVYQATDYTCGPSSLTAVLSYYGKQDLREMDLAQLAKTDSQVGTMPQALYRAVLQLGFKAEIRQNMTISLLQDCLDQKRPVIVLIQAWKDDDDPVPYPNNFENGHYVVAISYDRDYIYFEDPWIHGSVTYMRKSDLFDRWHGNTDEPYDRHVYGSGIIVLQPLSQIKTVIYLE